MSYGNYINLLNWNCRGLESLNQGHPNFAQLRAVLAFCLELEGCISLIIAGLLSNMELQLLEMSLKLERIKDSCYQQFSFIFILKQLCIQQKS